MANDEKAKLYKRIVETTSEWVLLDRMRLHGFWSPKEGLPADPPAEAAERQKVEAELRELRRRNVLDGDPEKLLAEERQRRWEASKARRAARKAERAAEAERRRADYARHKSTRLVHAGEGVSGGLQDAKSDLDLLRHFGLPLVDDAGDIAKKMGVPLKSLRWLTYHRKGATVVHYRRYEIAKKTGGVRCISAPKPALAAAQKWVLDNVLAKLPVEPAAHGFVPGRSVVTNAQPHVGKKVVANLDLQDFFPTITWRRVKGLFRRCGFSEHAATVLALLCTEPPRLPTEFDGKVYYVALGERVLPQGACTSPAITNVICRKLDRRLTGLAAHLGFTYTRYADDLTFSSDNPAQVGKLLKSVRSILTAEGFREHAKKTKVMRQARRQEVTGVTVNARPAVSRREVRELRAILHNATKHGLESQNRAGHPAFARHLRGRVEFVCMVDPVRGEPLRAALAKALGKA